MVPRQLVSLALRFGVAYALLLTLCIYWGDVIVTALIPLFRWELAGLLPEFSIVDLSVQKVATERVLALGVEVARPVNLGGLWPVGAQVESSTLLGHVLQPAVFVLSLLPALPAQAAAAHIWRLICGVVATLAALMCDVPVVLAGAVIDVMIASAPFPPQEPVARVVMMNFLNGGGRAILALGAAFAAYVGAGYFERITRRVRRRRGAVHDVNTRKASRNIHRRVTQRR